MVLQLSFNDFLRPQGARGAAIEVLDGKVWITEDGRSGDLFLEPGRSYRVAGPGLVVVSAEDRLHYARVVVRRPAYGWFPFLFRKFMQARRAAAARRQLGELSDHMLKDIGLTR